MRVGFLTTSYPREDGDPAGHFVAGFARWMQRNGADVEVMCAGDRGGLFYRGGAMARLRERPISGALDGARFCARLAASARRRREQWDAVVSSWLLPCGVIGARLRRPHLAIAHGSDVRLLRALPGGRSLVRALAREADLVYVAEALRVDGARGRVVPMGVEPEAPFDRDRARAQLGVHGCVVLILARLSREKGVDLAIEALPDRVTLLVAGEGPERARLQTLARGRDVRFLGEVRGEAKRAALAAADLLVVPSRDDGAPTVITEAALASLPIVAARTGGIPELVRDGEALLCAPEVASLRAAIETLRDHPELGPQLAASSLARARGRTWDTLGPVLAGRLTDRLHGSPGTLRVDRI